MKSDLFHKLIVMGKSQQSIKALKEHLEIKRLQCET